MNGMIQLVIVNFRDALLSLFPWDMDNTMSDGQRAHHITLAFRPHVDEAALLRLIYAEAKEITFTAVELRWNEEICALFGRLSVDGVEGPELVHVTLGGTCPPHLAAALLTDEECEVDEEVRGSSLLKYNEVEFQPREVVAAAPKKYQR
jgi:hypothetical protein